ncbi:MAG: hypothetical protein E7642_03370 [Ruminococcaceae bacterium]|nr:hypothetical protein [Oscillospiraceae bacterium]
MKTLTKLLCALLCLSMLFGMIGCNNSEEKENTPKESESLAKETEKQTEASTEKQTEPEQNDENKNENENNNENENESLPEKITSVYEISIFNGDYGSYVVKNYDSDGVLLSDEIRTPELYGSSFMIFEHNYTDNGVIDSTTVYRENEFSYYNNSYDKIATIEWETDENGKILSGSTGRDYDIPAFYDFTYHANGKLAKVELRDMGMYKNEVAFSVEYDENGNKTREVFDGDAEAIFTYTDGVITSMKETSLHNAEDTADYTLKYDTIGRITEIKRSTVDEVMTYTYDYVEQTNTHAKVSLDWLELGGDEYSEKQTVTFTYNENGFMSQISEEFNEDGEIYYTTQQIAYDDKGNVKGIIETDIEPDDDVHYVEEYKMEYDAKGQLIKKERESKQIDTANNGDSTVTGRQIKTYKYDENGNRTEYSNERFNSDGDITEKRIYKYQYDANGNLTQQEELSYNDSTTLSYRSLTKKEYNERGQETKRTMYSFDNDYETVNYYTVYEYEYSADSYMTARKTTEYREDGKESRTEAFTYDENGNETRVEQPKK